MKTDYSKTFLSAVKLFVGDPRTKIPKYLVLAGIAAISSQWWQPYLHVFLEEFFGAEIDTILISDQKLYVGGWVLIAIGLLAYLYVMTINSEAQQDELIVKEIADFLFNDLRVSWDVFADQLDITDLIRENHKRLKPEAQKKGFSALMSHVSSLEMKKRAFMGNLQKLRLLKEQVSDDLIISNMHDYWEKGINLCNDCMNEKSDRRESKSSCSASFETLNKSLSEKTKNR